MVIEKTEFDSVLIITPQIFEDERGFFYESYSKIKFLEKKLNYEFVQDNHSYNKHKYTFRGLHYQLNPKSQATLVRVVSGKIIDYIVDIRKGSPTYGKYISTLLSHKNHKQLLIPKGFAHGFLTLSDDTNVLYKMDQFYSKDHERGLNFKHIIADIKNRIGNNSFIINDKDKNAPEFEKIDNNFNYTKVKNI